MIVMVEVEDLYRLYERRIIRYIKYAKSSGSKELLPIKSDNFAKFMFIYYYSEYKKLSQLDYSKTYIKQKIAPLIRCYYFVPKSKKNLIKNKGNHYAH